MNPRLITLYKKKLQAGHRFFWYNEKDNEKINNEIGKDVISGEGKIIGKEYQGSLTSYEIEVTDELFRKKKLNAVMISGKKEYEIGQTVEYFIDKSNLYEIKS